MSGLWSSVDMVRTCVDRREQGGGCRYHCRKYLEHGTMGYRDGIEVTVQTEGKLVKWPWREGLLFLYLYVCCKN